MVPLAGTGEPPLAAVSPYDETEAAPACAHPVTASAALVVTNERRSRRVVVLLIQMPPQAIARRAKQSAFPFRARSAANKREVTPARVEAN